MLYDGRCGRRFDTVGRKLRKEWVAQGGTKHMRVPFDGLRVSVLGARSKLCVQQREWLPRALEEDVFDSAER